MIKVNAKNRTYLLILTIVGIIAGTLLFVGIKNNSSNQIRRSGKLVLDKPNPPLEEAIYQYHVKSASIDTNKTPRENIVVSLYGYDKKYAYAKARCKVGTEISVLSTSNYTFTCPEERFYVFKRIEFTENQGKYEIKEEYSYDNEFVGYTPLEKVFPKEIIKVLKEKGVYKN